MQFALPFLVGIGKKSHEMFNNVTIKADQGTFFINEIKRQFSDQNSLVVLTN